VAVAGDKERARPPWPSCWRVSTSPPQDHGRRRRSARPGHPGMAAADLRRGRDQPSRQL